MRRRTSFLRLYPLVSDLPRISEAEDLLVGGGEGLISQVGVVGESKCKLAVAKVVGRGRAVVEPLEEVAPREEALVEALHYFWIGGFEVLPIFAIGERVSVRNCCLSQTREGDVYLDVGVISPGELLAGVPSAGRELGNSSSLSTSANKSSNFTSCF
jgi:hypothetical protein